ncbi:MAG TPA: TolC family protein [Ideonella sp.]|nr:TolC family protein [Ideonella sp.]
MIHVATIRAPSRRRSPVAPANRWAPMPRVLLIACALAGAQLPALGQSPSRSFLPPDEVVERAIADAPQSRAAASQQDQAVAEARALERGPYETELAVIPQQRRVEGGTNYRELEALLTRRVRLPGKIRLDGEIGTLGSRVAGLRLADAHHQGARLLLRDWMAWLRQAERARLVAAQRDLMAQDRDAIAKRVRLGDAAQRDLDLADAGLARLQAESLAASALRDEAQRMLQGEFPRLPLPQRVPEIPAPTPLADAGSWTQRIVARSHEIGATDAEALRRQRVAERAHADRVPDPSFGVRYLDERGGSERALGLVFSIPLGSSARGDRAAAEQAAAAAAGAEAEAMRRRIALDADLLVQGAAAAQAQWQQLAQARKAAEAAAARSRRAYVLGEAAISEWIAAQRQAQELALAELDTRAGAVEGWLRVEVDSHELWHLHGDEERAAQTADATSQEVGALPDLPGTR